MSIAFRISAKILACSVSLHFKLSATSKLAAGPGASVDVGEDTGVVVVEELS
jgi:hypothetical protein